jgi:hypothetical protein
MKPARSAHIAFILAGAVGLAPSAETSRRGCATARHFERPAEVPTPSAGASATPGAARVAEAAATPPGSVHGRVLTTPRFALHYTAARSVHQPVWTAADASLKRARDSLHNVFPDSTRDSLLNEALDRLGAPHPVFVQRAAVYLESAYAYYVDTLGMIPPDSNIVQYFKGSVRGRFNVDIGDIHVLEGSRKTYGATFPPRPIKVNNVTKGYYSAQLVIDNDFLYDAVVNGAGTVSGTPLVNPSNKVNYNDDWDKGLAVTVAHEFYHAVQLKYTPTYPGGFHAWFELGAVAMEERLAPSVNDYLEYLKDLLPLATPISLFYTDRSTDGNYANGIFHMFLSHALGNAFDVTVWKTLEQNQNNLPAALLALAGSQARWDSLYGAYAASLPIAGLPGSEASPLAFSPDFPLWPRPRFDSARTASSTLNLGSLTYRLVKPVSAVATWASHPGIAGSWRVAPGGPAYASQYFADTLVPILPNGTLAQAVANGSFTQSRALTLKRGAMYAPGALSAYPNPAPRSVSRVSFSGPGGGNTASLVVVSESGRRAATLSPDPTGSFWIWNWSTPGGAPLPGVYYYGQAGQTPQTLLLLP